MKTLPDWHYSGFKHVGVAYANPAHAAQYDEVFARFRGNPAAGNEALLDELGVVDGTRFIDLGCGTGGQAIQAAQHGIAVYAVDILVRCCKL